MKKLLIFLILTMLLPVSADTPVVTITAPTAGAVWYFGSAYHITGTATAVDNITQIIIYLSPDNGANYSKTITTINISPPTPNVPIDFVWAADTTCSSCKIKLIANTASSQGFIESGTFAIQFSPSASPLIAENLSITGDRGVMIGKTVTFSFILRNPNVGNPRQDTIRIMVNTEQNPSIKLCCDDFPKAIQSNASEEITKSFTSSDSGSVMIKVEVVGDPTNAIYNYNPGTIPLTFKSGMEVQFYDFTVSDITFNKSEYYAMNFGNQGIGDKMVASISIKNYTKSSQSMESQINRFNIKADLQDSAGRLYNTFVITAINYVPNCPACLPANNQGTMQMTIPRDTEAVVYIEYALKETDPPGDYTAHVRVEASLVGVPAFDKSRVTRVMIPQTETKYIASETNIYIGDNFVYDIDITNKGNNDIIVDYIIFDFIDADGHYKADSNLQIRMRLDDGKEYMGLKVDGIIIKAKSHRNIHIEIPIDAKAVDTGTGLPKWNNGKQYTIRSKVVIEITKTEETLSPIIFTTLDKRPNVGVSITGLTNFNVVPGSGAPPKLKILLRFTNNDTSSEYAVLPPMYVAIVSPPPESAEWMSIITEPIMVSKFAPNFKDVEISFVPASPGTNTVVSGTYTIRFWDKDKTRPDILPSQTITVTQTNPTHNVNASGLPLDPYYLKPLSSAQEVTIKFGVNVVNGGTFDERIEVWLNFPELGRKERLATDSIPSNESRTYNFSLAASTLPIGTYKATITLNVPTWVDDRGIMTSKEIPYGEFKIKPPKALNWMLVAPLPMMQGASPIQVVENNSYTFLVTVQNLEPDIRTFEITLVTSPELGFGNTTISDIVEVSAGATYPYQIPFVPKNPSESARIVTVTINQEGSRQVTNYYKVVAAGTPEAEKVKEEAKKGTVDMVSIIIYIVLGITVLLVGYALYYVLIKSKGKSREGYK